MVTAGVEKGKEWGGILLKQGLKKAKGISGKGRLESLGYIDLVDVTCRDIFFNAMYGIYVLRGRKIRNKSSGCISCVIHLWWWPGACRFKLL